jgi:hypothetical protein
MAFDEQHAQALRDLQEAVALLERIQRHPENMTRRNTMLWQNVCAFLANHFGVPVDRGQTFGGHTPAKD